MHELLVDLLPWLAVFLAVDGLVELRRGHLMLVSGGGPLRLRRGGLRLVPPWPQAELVLLQDLPWLATPAALQLIEPGRRGELRRVEPADLRAVGWDGLSPRAEGKKVTAGARLLVVAPHPAVAGALAGRLATLASAPAHASPDPAGEAEAAFDAAVGLRSRQRPWLLPLRLTAGLLWLGLFGVGGALSAGLASPALGADRLLVALLGVLLLEVVLALGMLRACGLPLGRALRRALGLLAWPVAALRPLAALSPPLYAHLDALAVAAALLPATEFQGLAASELGRLEGSRQACGPALATAWLAREQALEALLSRTGSSAAAARRPPPALPGEAAWCPLCRAGYREGTGRCADCDAALRPY